MRRGAMVLAAVMMAGPAMAAVSGAGVSGEDHLYLIRQAQGGAYELSIAQMAQSRATRADVKAYAAKVVADHTRAQAQLDALVKKKGFAPISGVTPEDAKRFSALQAVPAAGFDAAYLKEVARINGDNKADDRKELRATEDPDMRTYVRALITTDAAHQEMADALMK